MAKRLPAAMRKYLTKGGKKATVLITAAQRSARARKAATTRWKKKEEM
jgi:hypothetical protein